MKRLFWGIGLLVALSLLGFSYFQSNFALALAALALTLLLQRLARRMDWPRYHRVWPTPAAPQEDSKAR